MRTGILFLKHLSILSLLLLHTLFASERALIIERKITHKIIHALIPNQSKIAVWFDGKKPPQSLQEDSQIRLVASPKRADLLILTHNKNRLPKELLDRKIAITLSYNLLDDYPQAVGAFFWQKGRPNLVFIAPRLNRHHLKLPNDFAPFIEQKVW